jgi:hypothetical protein
VSSIDQWRRYAFSHYTIEHATTRQFLYGAHTRVHSRTLSAVQTYRDVQKLLVIVVLVIAPGTVVLIALAA